MCAIVCYWRGKRQVRYVNLEVAETVCNDLELRGFTHIEMEGVNYD